MMWTSVSPCGGGSLGATDTEGVAAAEGEVSVGVLSVLLGAASALGAVDVDSPSTRGVVASVIGFVESDEVATMSDEVASTWAYACWIFKMPMTKSAVITRTPKTEKDTVLVFMYSLFLLIKLMMGFLLDLWI
jgi:hypothetical protein